MCVTESIKFRKIGYIKISFGVISNYSIQIYIYVYGHRDIYNILKMKKQYVVLHNVSNCGHNKQTRG
jgi:hypothetical protein